mmetsp:Transcript_36305/g.81777  ORF Transcript_36305/g.81777 Transcript_36305/m.81777 type:complete len:240 (+) Transcript_36305:311-1030(+)
MQCEHGGRVDVDGSNSSSRLGDEDELLVRHQGCRGIKLALRGRPVQVALLLISSDCRNLPGPEAHASDRVVHGVCNVECTSEQNDPMWLRKPSCTPRPILEPLNARAREIRSKVGTFRDLSDPMIEAVGDIEVLVLIGDDAMRRSEGGIQTLAFDGFEVDAHRVPCKDPRPSFHDEIDSLISHVGVVADASMVDGDASDEASWLVHHDRRRSTVGSFIHPNLHQTTVVPLITHNHTSAG